MSSLSRSEPSLGFSVVAHWVITGEKFRSDFCVGFMHKVFVNHSATVTCIAWDVLLADHMSRASNPIDRFLAVVAVNINVD